MGKHGEHAQTAETGHGSGAQKTPTPGKETLTEKLQPPRAGLAPVLKSSPPEAAPSQPDDHGSPDLMDVASGSSDGGGTAGPTLNQLYDDAYLTARAQEMIGAAECGDHGLVNGWMNWELYSYRPDDWRVFLAGAGPSGQAKIRGYLDSSCTEGLLAKMRGIVPAEIVTGGVALPPKITKPPAKSSKPHAPTIATPPTAAVPKPAKPSKPAMTRTPVVPFEGVAPGLPQKDALRTIYQSSTSRSRDLAKHLVNRNFEGAAMAAQGPAIGKDPVAMAAFVEAFDREMNAAIDENNRIMQAMSESGLGGEYTPMKHVAHASADIGTIETIIYDRYDGPKADYLKQLVRDGKSDPLQRAKLALGLVQKSRAAQETEVMHIVLEAPEQLGHFGMSWKTFWDGIKVPLADRVSSWHHKSLIRRLQAFSNVQFSEEELRELEHKAEEHADAEKEKVEKAKTDKEAAEKSKHGVHKASKEYTKATKDAEKVAAADEKLVADKKKELDDRRIEYLIAMIVNIRDELNDLEPEAVNEIAEWAQENKELRARAAAEPAVKKALAAKIKKERDRAYLLRVIGGDHDGKVAAQVAKHGFTLDERQTEALTEELVNVDAMMSRERAKHSLKKGKHHANLKSTLISLSPDAREAYLAQVSGKSKAQLTDRPLRHDALEALAKALTEVGLSERDAEEIAALFRVTEAGEHYAKLRALVLTSNDDERKSGAFGKQALKHVVALRGDEYAQVRADATVLETLQQSSEHVKIKAVLGVDTMLPLAPSEHEREHAKDDAELRAEHWTTLLDHELDKTRVPLPKVARQHRNEIHMIAHRAQQAAKRFATTQGKPATAAADFMKEVWQGLSHRRYFSVFYPTLSGKMEGGKEITVNDVLDEVLFHDGPLRLGGRGGPAFYTHVDQEDFVQAVLETKGTELLDEWSNITAFHEGLKEAQRRDQGVIKPRHQADDEDAPAPAPEDPKQHERAFKHQFVLDVKDDRKHLIKKAVGNGAAPAVLKQIRAGLRTAAESDPDFKDVLEQQGINTAFHRERIAMRGAIEQAEQRRKGWQLHGLSSKGTADSQNQRQLTGDARSAHQDIQTVPVQTDAHGHEDEHARQQEQDAIYRRDHEKQLAGDQAALERSGVSFMKLRQKIRKYTELGITIAIMVLATAIAIGITAASFGGAAPTLAPVALMWAKFGIMIAAKLTAVAITAFVKEAVGNQITGEEWDGRRVATDLAANSAGTVAGGLAGLGAGEAIEMGRAVTNDAAKEILTVIATAGAKTLAKQGVKGVLEQRRGDVTITDTLIALANSEVSSVAAAEFVTLFNGEPAVAAAKEHQADVAKDVHTAHDGLGVHEGQPTGGHESDTTQAEHVGEAGHDQLIEVGTGLDGTGHDVDVLSHGDGLDATGHADLTAANDEITQAHAALSGDHPNYELAQEHLSAAQHDLDDARLHADSPEVQQQIDEAHAHVVEASAKIDEAKEKIELQEAYEKAEQDTEAKEAFAKQMAYLGKPADFAVEQLLDRAFDDIEDLLKERVINKAAEVREKKLEHGEEVGEKAAKAHEAHHHGGDAHGGGAHGGGAHGGVAHGGATHGGTHGGTHASKAATKRTAHAAKPKHGHTAKATPPVTSAATNKTADPTQATPSAPVAAKAKIEVGDLALATTASPGQLHVDFEQRPIPGVATSYRNHQYGAGTFDPAKLGLTPDSGRVGMVNAANSALRGGGGVDGAIHGAAGQAELDADVTKWARDKGLDPKAPHLLDEGAAMTTGAGKLAPAVDSIIHTVGPRADQHGGLDLGALRACCASVLNEAAAHHLDTIVFTNISGGLFGGDPEQTASTIHAELSRLIATPPPSWKGWKPRAIIFNGFPGKAPSTAATPSAEASPADAQAKTAAPSSGKATEKDKEKEKAPEKASEKAKGPTGGIVNAGQSCYLASILNTIAATPPYRALFTAARGDDLEHLRQRIDAILTAITAGTQVGLAPVSKLLEALWQHGMYGEEADQRETGRQQDASEMLRWILDTFAPTAGDRGGLAIGQDTQNDFNGAKLKNIAGDASKHTVLPRGGIVHEPRRMELIVQLPIDQCDDLAGALAAYQRPEASKQSVVEDDQMKEGTAQRTTTLVGAPTVLTIALNRFTATGWRETFRAKRDGHQVDMPTRFRLNDHWYTLQAMIEHHPGEDPESARSGHYTAVTHSADGWRSHNDTAVGPEDAPALEHDRKLAYVYTYVRES